MRTILSAIFMCSAWHKKVTMGFFWFQIQSVDADINQETLSFIRWTDQVERRLSELNVIFVYAGGQIKSEPNVKLYVGGCAEWVVSNTTDRVFGCIEEGKARLYRGRTFILDFIKTFTNSRTILNSVLHDTKVRLPNRVICCVFKKRN